MDEWVVNAEYVLTLPRHSSAGVSIGMSTESCQMRTPGRSGGLVARLHKAMCGLRDMATGGSRHDEETRSPCIHSGATCVLSPGRGE